MSIEQYPSEDDRFTSLILECEKAIELDNLIDQDDIQDFYEMPCYELCEQVRKEFEAKYHLTFHEDSIYGFASEDDRVYGYNTIELSRPKILIPSCLDNGSSLELKVNTGSIKVPYLGIVIHSSDVIDDQVYTGPHFIGIFDTSNTKIKDLDRVLKPGKYTFITPLKTVEVSDGYIPHMMN